MSKVDEAIARRLAAQHGLVSRHQALAAGFSRRMIDSRLAAGRWIRVAPGVYRLAGVPVTWKQKVLVACLDAGPEAVASHRTAAVLYGVSGFRPGPIAITVPVRLSGRSEVATVHRARSLPRTDLARVDRIPVTAPARLLVDLAGEVSPDTLEEAVDDVLCRRLVTVERVRDRAHELGRRAGTALLRRILEAWTPGALPDSVAEMRIVRALVASGLPLPVRQHEIRVQGDLVARVDLAYPEQRLAIELDSFRWHAGRRPFRSDRVRRNRIEAAGWHVLQATPEDGAGQQANQLFSAARALLGHVA